MSNYNFDLSPGQTIPQNVGKADFFAVVLCPGDLEVKIPGSEFFLMGEGDSFTMPPNLPDVARATGYANETFSRLEVRNPSAANSVKVTMYIGTGRYEQRRQAVIEPATEFFASPVTNLAGGTGLAFLGVATGNRIRRKSISVSNLDPAAPLQLRDVNGNVALLVPAGHSITLPVSQYIQLYNPGGSAVSFAFNEIWWTL